MKKNMIMAFSATLLVVLAGLYVSDVEESVDVQTAPQEVDSARKDAVATQAAARKQNSLDIDAKDIVSGLIYYRDIGNRDKLEEYLPQITPSHVKEVLSDYSAVPEWRSAIQFLVRAHPEANNAEIVREFIVRKEPIQHMHGAFQAHVYAEKTWALILLGLFDGDSRILTQLTTDAGARDLVNKWLGDTQDEQIDYVIRENIYAEIRGRAFIGLSNKGITSDHGYIEENYNNYKTKVMTIEDPWNSKELFNLQFILSSLSEAMGTYDYIHDLGRDTFRYKYILHNGRDDTRRKYIRKYTYIRLVEELEKKESNSNQ